MDMFLSVAASLLLAAAVPFVTFLTHGVVERGRRKRAYARLVADPLIHVGAELAEIQVESRREPVIGPCRIHELAVGRMEVRAREPNTGHQLAISFTGREFERLIPVVRVRD